MQQKKLKLVLTILNMDLPKRVFDIGLASSPDYEGGLRYWFHTNLLFQSVIRLTKTFKFFALHLLQKRNFGE